MENTISISPFDLLRQRLKMPDPWIVMEATAVSKRQIMPRITNRIFRRIWLGVRLGSVAAAFSRLCWSMVLDEKIAVAIRKIESDGPSQPNTMRVEKEKKSVPAKSAGANLSKLIEQYGGPVQFSGTTDALYERHLVFDNVLEETMIGPRERFEAIARSVRDVLSQRWVRTETTYHRANASASITSHWNFSSDARLPTMSQIFFWTSSQRKTLRKGSWIGSSCWTRNLTQALAMEVSDVWLHASLIQWPQCKSRPWDTACATNMACSSSPSTTGGSRNHLTTGYAGLTHGKLARPNETVAVKLNCSFEIVGGILQVVPDRPSTLIGVPFDRPVVGYGGKTINTLRLWAAAAQDYFDFKEFSSGDFVGALAQTLNAESLTRVLYPNDSTVVGQGLRFVQEYFLVACSLADLVRRFRASNLDWSALPEKVAIQLNDTHPTLAVPELMRILLDEAHLGWDEAWDLTQKTLAYTNHTLLPEALEKWPSNGSRTCCRVIWTSSSKSIVDCLMGFERSIPVTRVASSA